MLGISNLYANNNNNNNNNINNNNNNRVRLIVLFYHLRYSKVIHHHRYVAPTWVKHGSHFAPDAHHTQVEVESEIMNTFT